MDYINRINPYDKSGYGDFEPDEFTSVLKEQGYNVLYEKFIPCPCQKKGDGQAARETCKNCRGTGSIYVNPEKTRMEITSMNLDKKIGFLGNADGQIDLSHSYFTATNEIKLSWMDRITLLESESERSELSFPIFDSDLGKWISILDYDVKQIYSIHIFVDDDTPLKRLEYKKDYFIQSNIIIIDDNNLIQDASEASLAVRYTHKPVYIISEILKDVRQVMVEEGGQRITKLAPIKAIGYRAHLRTNAYTAKNVLLNNDWKMENCSIYETEGDKIDRILSYTKSEDLFNKLTPIQRVELKSLLNNRLPNTSSISVSVFNGTTIIL